MAGDTATEAASALFGFGKAALHIESSPGLRIASKTL